MSIPTAIPICSAYRCLRPAEFMLSWGKKGELHTKALCGIHYEAAGGLPGVTVTPIKIGAANAQES